MIITTITNLKLETEIILDDSIIVMIDDRYIKDEVPGSMKSRALAIATKTSSLIRSGIPYLRINSVTESSS